jgi:hypothetical protein
LFSIFNFKSFKEFEIIFNPLSLLKFSNSDKGIFIQKINSNKYSRGIFPHLSANWPNFKISLNVFPPLSEYFFEYAYEIL